MVQLDPRHKGAARVEVLLRQQALKAKSDVDGNKISGEAAKSKLGQVRC